MVVSLNKIIYLSERYLPYWSLIIMFFLSRRGPAIFFPLVDAVGRNYISTRDHEESNATNFVVKMLLAFIIGFANIVPKRIIRRDISSYLSNFLGEELVIRDSPHTQLKSLTEVLTDIKVLNFVLFHTQFGNPIIITTLPAEQLCKLKEFAELLDTDTFDNNQTLRFIQLEDDVDSFFVLRDDIAVCSRTEALFFKWSNLFYDFANFKIRLNISDFELSLFGGFALIFSVLLVLLVYENPDSVAVFAWHTVCEVLIVGTPILALMFRMRKSKLASINFFTLSSKDRKYQPFNNIIVASDIEILRKIQDFKFFYPLFKFTPQSKYLIHTLLKCNENCTYDWINLGLKLKDFKRMAALAVSIFEKDVGIITPNAKVYYRAPRYSSNTCVVFFVLSTGTIKADHMLVDIFDRAAAGLRDGADDFDVENTFYN